MESGTVVHVYDHVHTLALHERHLGAYPKVLRLRVPVLVVGLKDDLEARELKRSHSVQVAGEGISLSPSFKGFRVHAPVDLQLPLAFALEQPAGQI